MHIARTYWVIVRHGTRAAPISSDLSDPAFQLKSNRNPTASSSSAAAADLGSGLGSGSCRREPKPVPKLSKLSKLSTPSAPPAAITGLAACLVTSGRWVAPSTRMAVPSARAAVTHPCCV